MTPSWSGTRKGVRRPDGSADPLRWQRRGAAQQQARADRHAHLRASDPRAALEKFMKIVSLAPEVL